MQVQPLASLSELRIWHHCELWYRPATAAPIQPLAYEHPYAASGCKCGPKKQKKKKEKKKKDIVPGIALRR